MAVKEWVFSTFGGELIQSDAFSLIVVSRGKG